MEREKRGGRTKLETEQGRLLCVCMLVHEGHVHGAHSARCKQVQLPVLPPSLPLPHVQALCGCHTRHSRQ